MKKTILSAVTLAASMMFGMTYANAAVVVVNPRPVVVEPAPVVVVKPRPRHVVVVERRPVVVVHPHHRVY
ncbi:hypothetical protein [Vibrio marisflavi]|nr:hypothetical protein [Vibrio marisflavi]